MEIERREKILNLSSSIEKDLLRITRFIDSYFDIRAKFKNVDTEEYKKNYQKYNDDTKFEVEMRAYNLGVFLDFQLLSFYKLIMFYIYEIREARQTNKFDE